MSLPLTPEMIEAAYEFLKTTPPFSRWKLPEGDDIEFNVGAATDEFANYKWERDHHRITISIKAVGHTETLIKYLAHEIIHLHLEATGQESKKGGPNCHNAAFRKFAAQVCKHHGFDPKAFY